MVLKMQHDVFIHLCKLQKLLSRRSSLTLVSLLKQSLHFLLWGGLLLLHQVSMAFGDTPAIRLRQRGAEWTTRSRFQLLPVVTASPMVGWVRIYAFPHTKYMMNGGLYLALTHGFVCISKLLPQLPCFSEPAGRKPLSAWSSSDRARMW